MLDPVSWMAIEAIAEILRGVSKDAGYFTDLGAGRIITDDEQVDDEEDTPQTVATIIDATDIDGGDTRYTDEMAVTVEYVIPRQPGLGNPKQLAHRGVADIRKALRLKENDRSLPRGIRFIRPGSARLRGWADEASQTSYVIAQVTARVGLTDPSQ